METFWELLFGTQGGSLLEIWRSVDGTHPLVAFVRVLSLGTLWVLAAVVLYGVTLTIIDTMRTGQPGGQVASVWSLLRWVLSVFGLIPMFHGYSAFALMVLSVAHVGSSLGNQVMRPYADSMLRPDQSGDTYASVVGSTRSGSGEEVVSALYRSGLCAGAMTRSTSGTANPVNVRVTSSAPRLVRDGNSEFVEAGVTFGSPELAKDGCGAVRVAVPTNSQSTSVLGAGLAGRRASDLHRNVVTAQRDVQQLVDESLTQNMPQERVQSRMKALADAYEVRDAADRAALVRVTDQAIKGRIDLVAGEVGGAPWMLAGAWYYDFGKAYQALHDVIRAQPVTKAPDWNAFSRTQRADLGAQLATLDESTDGRGIVDMLKRYQSVVTRPYAGPIEIITKSFYDGSKAVELWTSQFLASTGDDPVRSIQNLGFLMLTAVEFGYTTTVLVRALAATAKDVDFLPGVDTGALSGVYQIVSDITSPLMAVFWTLFSFAIALAYYLPLLPAILFTFAVISWLLDVVEGILATAFFAVTNAMPEGVGFFSQYGQSAISALIGILIRPALMIGSLIVSVLIMSFGTKLLLYGFNTAQSNAFEGVTMGLPSTLALFAIFTLLLLALSRRVFGMIITVPEAATQWVGARFAGRGEEASANEIEGRFGFVGAVQSIFNRRQRAARTNRNQPKPQGA